MGYAENAPTCRPLLARVVLRIRLLDSTNNATHKLLVYQADFNFHGTSLVPCIHCLNPQIEHGKVKGPRRGIFKSLWRRGQLRAAGCLHSESRDVNLWVYEP